MPHRREVDIALVLGIVMTVPLVLLAATNHSVRRMAGRARRADPGRCPAR